MVRIWKKGWVLMLSVLLLTAACGGQGSSQTGGPGPAAPAAGSTPESKQPAPEQKLKFPEKPIRIMVSHAAGGSTDVPGRLIGPYVAQVLGQPVVHENMVGAGGVLARNFVYKAPADGYTLLQTQTPSMDMAIYTSATQYDPLKFEPIYSITGKDYLATAVQVNSKYNTLKDLLEDLPKVSLTIAGAAGASQIITAQYQKISGGKLRYVPYSSSNEAAPALAGGHVNMVVTNVSTLAPLAEQGLIKILAVHGDEKLADYQKYPIAAEVGYPQLVVPQVTAIWAPPGTDPAIVKVLGDAFLKAGQDPKYLEDLKKAKLLADPRGPEEFRKFHKQVHNQIAEIGDLLKTMQQQ